MQHESEFATAGKDLASTPAIGISFQHQLDDHRSVVFQSFVPADCSEEDFNSMLDKLTKVSDRQRAKTHLPNTRSMLRIKNEQLKAATEKLLSAQTQRDLMNDRWAKAHIASGRRGEFKPNAIQAQEKGKIDAEENSARATIAGLKNEIMQLETTIAEMEAKVGDGG